MKMYLRISFYEISFTTGELKSPNYPNAYPNNFERLDIIEVEEGLIVALQFAAFDLSDPVTLSDRDLCRNDHLTIRDGDGTTLMEKTCGSSLPGAITSTSNIVHVNFVTGDNSDSRSGWNVTWSAVTPGEKLYHCTGVYRLLSYCFLSQFRVTVMKKVVMQN